MPEGLSITKQALARGYAVIAINSADRSTTPGGRCWRWAGRAASGEAAGQRGGERFRPERAPSPCRSWKSDAVAVRDLVESFRRNVGLLDRPLFLTGCSCARCCCRLCRKCACTPRCF